MGRLSIVLILSAVLIDFYEYKINFEMNKRFFC